MQGFLHPSTRQHDADERTEHGKLGNTTALTQNLLVGCAKWWPVDEDILPEFQSVLHDPKSGIRPPPHLDWEERPGEHRQDLTRPRG